MKSLFNKGIYKSTMRRFWWVSVLYFAVLFMLTCIVAFTDNYIDEYVRLGAKYLFNNSGFMLVLFAGMVIASVMALFVYRFVHSKKQAVFVYSLPVSREANFVSSALAGLTLLILPVLLNGAALIILSLTGYREYFGIYECVEWITINLLCIFIMFAYSGFSAMLTGNAFAAMVVNITIHAVMIFSGVIANTLAEKFLFGYVAAEGDELLELAKQGPVGWLFELAFDNIFIGTVNPIANIEAKDLLFHLGVAIVMYIVSFVLCIKRRMESAGETGGFKILNPIYKYGMTFLILICMFEKYADELVGRKIPAFMFAIIAVGAVVYFILEAIIRKKLGVWRSYKGFLVFISVFILFVVSLMYTSFFGFETRVPNVNNIESVAMWDETLSDLCVPYVKNEEIKRYTTDLHKELLQKGEVGDKEIYIEYRLKNGTTIVRKYEADSDTAHSTRKKLSEYDEYRRARYENIFNGFENIEAIRIGSMIWLYGDHCIQFLECVKKDLIECDTEALCREKYYVTVDCGEEEISFYISDGFIETVDWLKTKGDWKYIER